MNKVKLEARDKKKNENRETSNSNNKINCVIYINSQGIKYLYI